MTLNEGGGGGGGGTSELRGVLSQRERFRLRDVKQALKEAAGVEEEAGSMDEFLRGEVRSSSISFHFICSFIPSFHSIPFVRSFGSLVHS